MLSFERKNENMLNLTIVEIELDIEFMIVFD